MNDDSRIVAYQIRNMSIYEQALLLPLPRRHTPNLVLETSSGRHSLPTSLMYLV
jgi:hypothetical protein